MKRQLFLFAGAMILSSLATAKANDNTGVPKECQKAARYFVLHSDPSKHTRVTPKGQEFAATLISPTCMNINSDLIKKAKESELFKNAAKNAAAAIPVENSASSKKS